MKGFLMPILLGVAVVLGAQLLGQGEANAQDIWAYKTIGGGEDVYVQSETCRKYLDEDHWVYSANLKYVDHGRLSKRCSVQFAKIGPNYYEYSIDNGRMYRISNDHRFMNTLRIIKEYTGE